jgi:hypothetical protein
LSVFPGAPAERPARMSFLAGSYALSVMSGRAMAEF